ncbi:MAG: homocysteine S-methyltransferase [Planctomycetes bacterium]|nr:homocysteine S-methyltransferase [Planctomycetota bacterium]
MTSPIARRLAFGPALLFDGALATELERRGFDLAGGLWSARALRDAPELIRAIHLDYLAAGAELITSASYQASFVGFAAAGIDEAEGARLLERSIGLAREAVATAGPGPRRFVAASCGPYGAMLGGGHEYDGDYGEVDESAIADFHRRRLELLLGGGADLILFETIPRQDEALIAAELLEDLGGRGILSFQIGGPQRLGNGDSLRQATEELQSLASVVAIGINCCAPSIASAGLDRMLEVSLKPIIVQANSGEGWDGSGWTPAPAGEDLVAEAQRWLDRGARGIGGCCRSRPETIARLRRLIDERDPGPQSLA